MPVTYDASVKTARMTAVKTEVGTDGKLKIRNSSDTVLATIPLGSGGTVSGAVWTLIESAASDTSADATGTAANAIITTSGDVTKVSGLTVGTSGTDIVLDNLSIAAGQAVTINSASITHA